MAREVLICNQEKTLNARFLAGLTPQQNGNVRSATSKESAESSYARQEQTTMRRVRSDASKKLSNPIGLLNFSSKPTKEAWYVINALAHCM